jgi:uncharacterized protein YkwD
MGGDPLEENCTMTGIPALRPPKRRSVGGVVAIVLLALTAAACMPKDARTFLDRTNGLRASHGVKALQEHDTLTRKAEAWAQHMASTGRLEHSQLSANLGSLRWRALAENVAYSTPSSDTLRSIHNMFVNSSGHRANMLGRFYTHMGVGVATDRTGKVWVAEVFATL